MRRGLHAQGGYMHRGVTCAGGLHAQGGYMCWGYMRRGVTCVGCACAGKGVSGVAASNSL